MLFRLNQSHQTIYSPCSRTILSFALYEKIRFSNTSHCIITHNAQSLDLLYKEISILLGDAYDVYLFSDLELLPYENFSSSNEIRSNRIKTLYNLSKTYREKPYIVVVSASTLLKRLPSTNFITQNSFQCKIGEKLFLSSYRKQLIDLGYRYTSMVEIAGEFCIKGSMIDIFPMGSLMPYRVDMFDNEIDSINIFDIETQRSVKRVDSIDILPTHEFTYSNNHEIIKSQLSMLLSGIDTNKMSKLKKELYEQRFFGGIDFYLPLFHSTLSSFFDYLRPDTEIHCIDNVYSSIRDNIEQIQNRFNQAGLLFQYPPLSIEKLYLSESDINQAISQYKSYKWLSKAKAKSFLLRHQPLPNLDHKTVIKNDLNSTLFFIDHADIKNKNIIFCSATKGKQKLLIDKLHQLKIFAFLCDDINDALQNNNKIISIVADLCQGFITKNHVIITDYDLHPHYIYTSQKKTHTPHKYFGQNTFSDLSDLKLGGLVVHIDYGIGIYRGLKTLDIGSNHNEMLWLEYKNQENLYVPINRLYTLSSYTVSHHSKPPLSKLGSDKWNKDKEKALKKIYDIAANLLAIYAQRSLKRGISHHIDPATYESFSNSFPYDETEDQHRAINDVLHDMKNSVPMDRLICGDVGYGKTEVAMRATFVAINNNYQVVILVPTTLLAQQHYDNFYDRFSPIGAHVELLTRFKTISQQRNILASLGAGKIDIIIGTHKLLSPLIKFSKLGLVIIDEEHRFGVTHKEKLKALRSEVDILTMSATPLPRTLNMALSAIRDMSIITTPPAKRLSVKTFVHEYNKDIVVEAVTREAMRGGQVFYLYNSVDRIYNKLDALQEQFPTLKIRVAHGQMKERELENIMFDFQQNSFHILLCTTIIETGINIPNSNTLIIENAENFGLAQLHQLRGRVGRSAHQAFAYFMTSDSSLLSSDAKKRLLALKNTNSIGGGYLLANHDLEIRGAGEVLGKDQSGNIQGIGLSLYTQLLSKATQSLKNGILPHDFNLESSDGCEIELRITALLPKSYIDDTSIRLYFYNKLSNANHTNDIDDIKSELIDRFGTLPIESEHLLAIQMLKLQAQDNYISKIEMHSAGAKIQFLSSYKKNGGIQKLMSIIQSNPQIYQLHPDMSLLIKIPLNQAQKRIDFIQNIIQSL